MKTTDELRRDAVRLHKEGERLVAESDALWKKIHGREGRPPRAIEDGAPDDPGADFGD